MGKYYYLCRRKNNPKMLTQFKQYLKTKDITPTTEVEEQITFLMDGLYYLFVYEKSDSNYFRLILPNIFKIEKDKDKYESLVNDINLRFKVAKTFINNDGMIWIAVEQFIYSAEGIGLMFERCLMLLKIVIEYFREQQSKLSHD